MKHILTLIFSGIIGGLIVFGAFMMTKDQWVHTLEVDQAENNFARQVNFRGLEKMPLDFTVAAEKAMPAVVHIKSTESDELAEERYQRLQEQYQMPDFFGRSPFGRMFGDFPQGMIRPNSGMGSGVIIREDGYIVTNNHVVDFADQFEVTLYDGRTFKGELVGQDPRTDLAVIKIDEKDLPVLQLGDSEEIKVGEWVLAVGNPFDLTSSVTAGIVSAKGRKHIIRDRSPIEDFIQTDAAVNSGNSGGALVDSEGNLIGINTAIATPTGVYAGYSFAIPADIVDDVVENIIAHGGPRPVLGVRIADINEQIANEFNLKTENGVFVAEVVKGSAAERAGILPYDVIIDIEGEDVETVQELQELISSARIGEKMSVKINREGKLIETDVMLRPIKTTSG